MRMPESKFAPLPPRSHTVRAIIWWDGVDARTAVVRVFATVDGERVLIHQGHSVVDSIEELEPERKAAANFYRDYR